MREKAAGLVNIPLIGVFRDGGGGLERKIKTILSLLQYMFFLYIFSYDFFISVCPVV